MSLYGLLVSYVRSGALALAGSAALCVSLTSPLIAQSSPGAQPASRITAPIVESNLVALPGNVHPLASSRYDKGEAPLSSATGRVELLLRRSSVQQLALTQYLADVQNPHSASYRKWLTPSQYGAAFGISDGDLQTVEQWLQGHGFKVEGVSSARNTIQFSGDFGQIQNAFHTSIHVFEIKGERHYANTANPLIPAALQAVIAGVGPLNDFRPVSQAKFASTAHYDPSSKTIKPDLTLFSRSGTPYLYVDPADAATIYDTPNATLNPAYTGTTYDGTGVNIGIAGDSNITMQDVTNYRVAFLGENASSANVPTVIVDGNDPLLNGDEVEALLDTEVAGGIAPKAKLYLYTAANTNLQSGLFDAIFRALNDNIVSILNISFGACEASFGTSGNQLVSEVMQQAAAQGISVTVSTGDDGSAGCDSDTVEAAQNGLAVNGLASTPYNIAVGGTDFDDLLNNFTTYVTDSSDGNPTSGAPPYYRTALSYIPERPWNDSTYPNNNTASNDALSSDGNTNIIAGSGGASSCVISVTNADNSITCQSGYTKPPFQSALTPADGVRDLPDVAFLAANGLYSATWVVCADNVAEGSPTVFTDCQTTNGNFTSSTSFSGVGGTSAAAPAFAGMLALVEQKTGSRLGQANYIIYQLAKSKYASVFHDITEGDNSVVCISGSPNCGNNGFLTGYDAAVGYDQASGLGSIDATQMLNSWSTVALTSTATSFTINGSTTPLTITHGTTVTFNVGVSPASATGAVAIVDTANEIPGGVQNNGQIAIPLSGGNGLVTYNGLPGGTYTVFAHYSGDTSDAASTSTPGIEVNIAPEASTTVLSLNAYSAAGNNPAITALGTVPYGSYIFATAQIEGKAEGANTQGIATGTVTITDNGAAITSALPISQANQASYSTPSTAFPTVFAPGSHKLVANYSGDPSFNTSSSTPASFTIVQGATNVSLTANSTSIDSFASTQLTIDIGTSSLGSFPTGNLVVTANGATLATITGFQRGYGANGDDVSIGTLTIQGTALAAGANIITATYSGDANYTGSSASITINVAESSFALSNSGALTLQAGATSGNTATIAVTPANGFTGIVNLACSVTTTPANAASPATCAVPSSVNITGTASASATLTVTTTSGTTAGAYVITVTGVDASTGKISQSSNVNATVTAPTVSSGFALTNGGSITVSPGASTGNTSTVSITPSGGFTGQVNLSCAVTTSITNPTDAPTCTIPTSVTVSGTSAATATLTVATTGSGTAFNNSMKLGLPGAMLAALFFLGVPRRRRWAGLLGALVLLIVTASAIGCGGSPSSSTSGTGTSGTGTTAGAYTVTVTGVDAATGKITETTAIAVTVN
jgi:trimeric autotransporter adhesin